jgi:hypothetical protein
VASASSSPPSVGPPLEDDDDDDDEDEDEEDEDEDVVASFVSPGPPSLEAPVVGPVVEELHATASAIRTSGIERM